MCALLLLLLPLRLRAVTSLLLSTAAAALAVLSVHIAEQHVHTAERVKARGRL